MDGGERSGSEVKVKVEARDEGQWEGEIWGEGGRAPCGIWGEGGAARWRRLWCAGLPDSRGEQQVEVARQRWSVESSPVRCCPAQGSTNAGRYLMPCSSHKGYTHHWNLEVLAHGGCRPGQPSRFLSRRQVQVRAADLASASRVPSVEASVEASRPGQRPQPGLHAHRVPSRRQRWR